MDHNVEYVVAGYALTAVTVVAYTVWTARRLLRARRSWPDRGDG
jgi:hypothetical protein